MLIAKTERRLLERQLLDAPVFLFRDESASEVGELHDINQQGAFFYTNAAVSTRTELALLLLVPAEGFIVPVFCAAQTVRVVAADGAGYHHGVAVTFRKTKMLDIVQSGDEEAPAQERNLTQNSSQEVTACVAVLDR